MQRLACLIASLAVSTAVLAQSPAASAAGGDSLAYDKAVATVWGHINSARYVVDWCSSNARSSKASVQKAYRQWSSQFAAQIADINRRMDAVMNPGGQVPAKEFEQRKAELMNRGAQRFANGMAGQPADVAQRECAELPQRFEEGSFDLEKLFAGELRLIRQHAQAR